MKYDIYDKIRDYLQIALIVGLLGGVLAYLIIADSNCHARGGVLVRGAFWLECVPGK